MNINKFIDRIRSNKINNISTNNKNQNIIEEKDEKTFNEQKNIKR